MVVPSVRLLSEVSQTLNFFADIRLNPDSRQLFWAFPQRHVSPSTGANLAYVGARTADAEESSIQAVVAQLGQTCLYATVPVEYSRYMSVGVRLVCVGVSERCVVFTDRFCVEVVLNHRAKDK